MARLFSPYVGSGYTPLAISVVSTVPGTTAMYQLWSSNAGLDTCSGVAATDGAGARCHAPIDQRSAPSDCSAGVIASVGERTGVEKGALPCGSVQAACGCCRPRQAFSCHGQPTP